MADTISMTKLTKILEQKGIKAQFCMSGGNCGTIYIGEFNQDGYAEFAIGPSNYSLDEAYFGEICWGKDDQGESEPFFFNGDESTFTEEFIALQIFENYLSSKAVA